MRRRVEGQKERKGRRQGRGTKRKTKNKSRTEITLAYSLMGKSLGLLLMRRINTLFRKYNNSLVRSNRKKGNERPGRPKLNARFDLSSARGFDLELEPCHV